MFRPPFFVILCLLALSALCLRAATDVEEGNKTRTLHIGCIADPDDLDTQLANSQPLATLLNALFEGLTRYDPVTCEPRPGVAERWEVSSDGLAWTFHLRADARWSNGDPVTADDFVFSFRRLLSPALAAGWANVLYPLKNARAFNAGRVTDPALVGARAVDARTLVLTLEHPVPWLPSLLCYNPCFPVHRASVEKLSGGGGDASARRGGAWTRPGNLVSNGPFMLAEWLPAQHIRVVKNPFWHGAAAVRLNAAVFHFVDNEDVEERMFRAGQLHVTHMLPVSKIDAYQRDPRGVFVSTPLFAVFYFAFNCERPPFDDARVRRAFSLAIDRERLVKYVTRGGQRPAGNFCPPGIAGFTSRTQARFDAAAARALLAAAGYPGGKGFPKVELLAYAVSAHRAIAEAAQEMWRRELGVEVSIRSQEMKVAFAAMVGHDYAIASTGESGIYLDPCAFFDGKTSDSHYNLAGWKNVEYDRLVAEAGAEADAGRRNELYQRCEQILGDECPLAPVYFMARDSLRLPNVRGWSANPLETHPLESVWLEGAK